MRPNKRVPILALAATLAATLTAVAACTGSSEDNVSLTSSNRSAGSCPLPSFGPGTTYRPAVDKSSFSAKVDNPFFPLTPGVTLVYAGTKDGKAALNIFAASARTVVIDGVTTRAVEDRLYLDNVLEERTRDYYAQDRCGNVWYFGEDTATLDSRGHVVSTDGTWHAGVAGAQPGVFMQAEPEVGRSFRQEWFTGHAEDVFQALQLSTRVKVPAGRFTHALQTKEITALEPEVVDNKYFARGVGEVIETSVKGPLERLQLVDVLR